MLMKIWYRKLQEFHLLRDILQTPNAGFNLYGDRKRSYSN